MGTVASQHIDHEYAQRLAYQLRNISKIGNQVQSAEDLRFLARAYLDLSGQPKPSREEYSG